MPCSVARVRGSTVIILVTGANIRGYWQRVLGHCSGVHVVGCRHSVCGKALVCPRTFVGKACVGAQGRALDAARQKSKGKNCFENMNITRL